jgi:hypothetical protein
MNDDLQEFIAELSGWSVERLTWKLVEAVVLASAAYDTKQEAMQKSAIQRAAVIFGVLSGKHGATCFSIQRAPTPETTTE